MRAGGRVAIRREKMYDDDDEEYVAEEDEEDVDEEYVAAACSDEDAAGEEEEPEAEAEPEPDDESDADFDGDEESEAEDEDFEIETPRPKRRPAPAKPRRRGRKAKPEDESDADFDEGEELEIEAPRPKPERAAKARGRGRKARRRRHDGSDADSDEDEDFKIEAPRPKRPGKARGRGRKARPRRYHDSDAYSDEDDDEPFQIEAPRPKRPAKARGRGRKVKKPRDDSDEDFDEDEELEDDGFEMEAQRQRRPAAFRSRNRKREDESDADFDVGEEELEIEARPAAARSRGGRKGSQEDESDADFGGDEEELEDEELEIETRPAEVRSRGRKGEHDNESDADFDGEEEELEDEGMEIETPRPKSPTKVPSCGRIEMQDVESDEDFNEEQEEPEDQEEEEEELVTETLQPMQLVEGHGWGRKKKPSGSRRPRHEDDDDYEEEIEDEDEDFEPEVDEEEDDDEEEVEEDDEDLGDYVRPKNHLAKRKPVAGRHHRKRRSGSKVSKGKARKGTSAHQRRRKQWVNEDDHDFVVNDDVEEEVDHRPRKKAKVGRKTRDDTAEPTVGETWPSLESDTSEFEFVTSEEEGSKNETPMAESLKIKRKKGRRKKGSDSDSSSDSDYVISEEELKDLRLPGPQDTVPQLPLPTARRTTVLRRVDEKGKEPEEALKQICGICLSEEQRATIQGLLNCCSHYFCFACILEWSKVESKCPLCKRRFNTITKSSVADVGSGLRNAAIRVEKRDQVYQPTEEEIRRWLDPYENVVCIECNQGGEDNLMLLCDICDSSAHTFCVGLGREVPEGNWYCGGCRSSVEGPSYAQTQDRVVHRGESNMNIADSSSSSFGRSVLSGVFQRPPPLNIDQPSLQGFDLNLSPIETPDEDKRGELHISAEPLSTPTGRHATLDRRRALNRRIRILLFIPRTATNAWQNGLQHDRTTPVTEQNQRSTSTSTDVSPSCSRADLLQSQQSNSHFVQSTSNLAHCTDESGSNFREVANAKEQLIPIVKKSIKHICAQSPLDQSSFMNVARRATNTILALSGIEHNRDRVVATPFPFPSHCCHACDGREPAFLMRTICSACFNSFVLDVVSHIADMFS